MEEKKKVRGRPFTKGSDGTGHFWAKHPTTIKSLREHSRRQLGKKLLLRSASGGSS